MKKYYTLVIALFVTLAVQSQSSHTVGFESSVDGAGWTWTMAENGTNPALEFIANPVSGGINTSANVAKFTALQTGNAWALVFTDGDGEFTFDASNKIVKIKVYKSRISGVAIKVEGGTGTPLELNVSNTLVNQWEELTFDFSARIGQKFGRLVIIPDFLARTSDQTVYFDDLVVPDGVVPAPLPAPTTAAPVPPSYSSSDVVSMFSDAFTPVAGVNLNPGWGQATTVSTVDIAGNSTLKYAGLNYQGTEFPSQDVSAFDAIHIDYWTPNSTALKFTIISAGQEKLYTLPITTETWSSVDIPLSYFSNVALASVFQFKVEGNGTVYLDNLYFHKGIPTALETHVASDLAVTYSRTSSTVSVSGSDISSVEIINISGTKVKSVSADGVTSLNVSMDDLNNGIYIISVTSQGKVTNHKIIKK